MDTTRKLILTLFLALNIILLCKSLAGEVEFRYRSELQKNTLEALSGDDVLGVSNLPDDFIPLVKDCNVVTLWNGNATMCIAIIDGEKYNLIMLFRKDHDGKLCGQDISRIENANLGKLGKKREDYIRVKTKATKWIERDDEFFQVVIKTTAYTSSGRAENAQEMQIFNSDGCPIWR